jgi:Flp pilus assembly protein TadB
MTDPYRIHEADQAPPAAGARAGRTRPVLWILLAVSAALNVVTSSVNVLLGAAFGVVALACIAALVVQHYRTRR